MTTRSEREKAQKLNEQHQAILSKLLREEDNKYCADCEAKGPRWASWNLGVFICIRCAGIHRNLGVHISRVKSVNLDQWTSDQMQCIKDMGNTKARRLYEANLPDSFRRPQTDQAVELFIRDKYEKKKYYGNNVTNGNSPKDGKKEKEPDTRIKVIPYTKNEEPVPVPKISPVKTSEPSLNLLGLEAPVPELANDCSSSTSQNNNDLDIFGPMVSNPLPASTSAAQFSQFSQMMSSNASIIPTPAQAAGVTAGSATVPEELDLFNESNSTTKTDNTVKQPLSKDSILSLYGTHSISHSTSAAAMFMGPSQIQIPVQASTGYQALPGMATPMPHTSVMGAMMAQSTATMMGPSQTMMVGMTMPNGFMGNAPTAGVMSMTPRMMRPPGGALPSGTLPAQGIYAIQPGQQVQLNMSQVNQQMSAFSLNGTGGQMTFSQPSSSMGGWTAAGSAPTLSTQLWK
ncbi:stromal membrane-associated protein 1-like isoform X1 [Cynoglossus semilaevis]|nr:stromal membrane-associated protein 1-like isoform X1 [Cynoglossus semilaevis]